MTRFTRAALSQDGFVGWVTFDHLLSTDPCPLDGGIYVVARTHRAEPSFLDQSCGGWFKGRDPTVTVDALVANWVTDAEVVYIGKGNNLRRRLREFAKFGAGQPIGHWGGRLIWQLAEAPSLIIGWKATPDRDPSSSEAEFIADFRRIHGKPPFANNPHLLGS
jgi:hypothetical protein